MFDLKSGCIMPILAVVGTLFATVPTAVGQTAGQTRTLPAPVVAVVDFKRAVEVSLAGKSVVRQIRERHAQIQEKIAKDTAALEQNKQELERQRALLAPDVFKQKWREFQVDVQRYRQSVQSEQRKLDKMHAQGILKIEVKLASVLSEIANELGANMVIDAGPGRGNVLFTDSKLLVTKEATQRLNQVLPDVKIEEPAANPKAAAQTPRLQVPKVQ